jgi:hypothetical protein
MGSAQRPNHLVEASLVSTPAQVSAVVTERLHRGAERAAAQLTRGLPAEPQDLDRLLAVLARDARVRSWLRRQVSDLIREERGNVASAPASDFFAQLRER